MTTTPSVQFIFDFGSPNAYLSHRVIPDIESRTGATFEYVPVLLGGLFKLANNRSPAEAYADIPNKSAYEQLEFERFIRKHRLDRFRFNPGFPINTLKIMRGAVAAQKQDIFPVYIETVFTAMWEQQRDMADPDTIVEVLGSAGLDAEGLLSATQDPEIKDILLKSTQAVFERGAFGSPTFFVGKEMYFGKDRLGQVEEEILLQSG